MPAGNGAGIRLETRSVALLNWWFMDSEFGLVSAGRSVLRLVLDGCLVLGIPTARWADEDD